MTDPQTSHPEASSGPAWPVWSAPAAIVLGLSLGLLMIILLDAFAAGFGVRVGHPTPAVSLLGDVLFDLSLCTAAIYFASRAGRLRAIDFGYARVDPRRAVVAVIVAAAAYYALTYLYATLFALHAKDKLPTELGVHRSSAALVATAVFVCVIAPIAEELFFRGFLFGVLRRWRGALPAALIVGVLFGFAHLGSAPIEDLVPLACFGIVLCLLRWRTDSLLPAMALHSLNNALALGVNDLHWSVVALIGLMFSALAVIGALTLPLVRSPRQATA